jgi:hypothetical protein
MTQTMAVTATFGLKIYPVIVRRAGSGTGTVTSTPAGINCGSLCLLTFYYGTVVSLTATPALSSTFAAWSGACEGLGPCAVTLTQTRAVTATFVLKTYTVTVVLSGTGSGVVTSTPAGITCGLACAASFTYGTALTFTAAPTAGSDFAGWGGACSGVDPCGMALTQSVTLTATFYAQPPSYKTYLPMVAGGAASSASQRPPAGWDGTMTILAGWIGLRRRNDSRYT